MGDFILKIFFFSLDGTREKYEGESIFVKYSDDNDDSGKEVLCWYFKK